MCRCCAVCGKTESDIAAGDRSISRSGETVSASQAASLHVRICAPALPGHKKSRSSHATNPDEERRETSVQYNVFEIYIVL
jgi:hypothetical protein